MNSHHGLGLLLNIAKKTTSKQVNEKHTNTQQLLSIRFLSCLVCGVSRDDILQDLQSSGQKHPSMEARTKHNYTIVPAIEDNADSLECFLFHFVRYLWLALHYFLLDPSTLSHFLVGSLPPGLLLNILRPKPQQLKRSVAKSPRRKFTENVPLWCLIQLHCNLSLPLGSRGQRMMQDVSIKCLTFLHAIKQPNGMCTKRCRVKEKKKLFLICLYLCLLTLADQVVVCTVMYLE